MNIPEIKIFKRFTNELRYNSGLLQSQEGDILNLILTSLMIDIPVIWLVDELIIMKVFETFWKSVSLIFSNFVQISV